MSVVESGKAPGSFAYEAQTPDGQRFKGTLEAASPEEVQARLSALQLHVLSVVPVERAAKARGSGLGADEFLIFNQQLAHLTEAGLPVERGLRLIAIDLKSGRLSRAAQGVAEQLERGVPLEQAFAGNSAQFPPLYGKLVEAGAKAGNLPAMLFNLGRHLELKERLRQSLWRTVSYPVVVLVALSLVLLFVSLRVLPFFQNMFEVMARDFRHPEWFGGPSFEGIPWPTQLLMNIGGIYPFVLAGVAGVVALVLGVDGAIKLSGQPGIRWLDALRHTPLIGKILRLSLLARWIDAVRLGIEAGLDLPRAIALAGDATSGSQRLARDSAELAELISGGKPLVGYQGRVIPATIPAAIELGSATADLPAVLWTLTRMYEEQAEHRLRLLPAIITPLMMIGVGGGIGLCIAALLLPYSQLLRYLTFY